MSQRLYAVMIGDAMLHTSPSSDEAFRMFDILRQTELESVSVSVLYPRYIDFCDEPTWINGSVPLRDYDDLFGDDEVTRSDVPLTEEVTLF